MVKMLKPRIKQIQIKQPSRLTVSETRRTRGSAWQQIRERVMTRDSGLCCECKRSGVMSFASEVDHVTPLWEGGTDDVANLQALCRECHKDKTKREAARRSGAEW